MYKSFIHDNNLTFLIKKEQSLSLLHKTFLVSET